MSNDPVRALLDLATKTYVEQLQYTKSLSKDDLARFVLMAASESAELHQAADTEGYLAWKKSVKRRKSVLGAAGAKIQSAAGLDLHLASLVDACWRILGWPSYVAERSGLRDFLSPGTRRAWNKGLSSPTSDATLLQEYFNECLKQMTTAATPIQAALVSDKEPKDVTLTDGDRYILKVLDVRRGTARTFRQIELDSIQMNRDAPNKIKRLSERLIRDRVPVLLDRGYVARPPGTQKKGISITDAGHDALTFAAGNPPETRRKK